MSGGSGVQEILSQGPEREPRPPRPPRPPRFPRLGQLARWRPPPVVTVVVVTLVAGAVWAGYAITAPRLPLILMTALPNDQGNSGEAQTPWRPAFDGRPVRGVQLKVNAVISAPDPARGKVTVLGMSGPGVVDSSTHPVLLAAHHSTAALLVADIDCRKVRFPARPSDYRIRLKIVDGSRSASGTMAAGAVSTTWATSLDQACGSWLARHDLTVTHVSAIVDRTRPGSDLTLQIDNAGERSAYLGFGWTGQSIAVSALSPPAPVIPPKGRTTISVHVDVGLCDAVPPPPGADGGGGFTTTGDYLGLVALVGARPKASAPRTDPPMDGLGPTGILIAPAPATVVAQALRSACGGLNQFVTLLAPGGFHVDPRTRVLAVRILIDGTPGRVSYVQLVSDSAPGDALAFVPLWTELPRLVPDASGQFAATLHYRLPASSGCPSMGAWFPSFTLVAHVPVAGSADLTLRYGQFIDPSESTQAIRELCGP